MGWEKTGASHGNLVLPQAGTCFITHPAEMGLPSQAVTIGSYVRKNTRLVLKF